MKNIFVLFVVTLCFVSSGFAQDQIEPVRYRHHIGFNTNFILGGLYGSTINAPFDFMYKKQSDHQRATRLGFSLSGNGQKDEATSQNNINSISFDVALVIGQEWRNRIAARWEWYGGADVIPSFGTYSYRQSTAVNSEFREEQTRRYGIQLRPFLGLAFQINERLYVATEAALLSGFSFQRSERTPFMNSETTLKKSTSRTTTASVRALPSSGISLFYQF